MSQEAPQTAALAKGDAEAGAIIRREGLAMSFTGGAGAGVRLQSFAELIAFGRSMIDSGFVPKGYTLPAQVVWTVQRGAELGLGPTAALDAFYLSPNGGPELYAEAALGICVASGLLLDTYEKWTDGEGDKLTGHFRFQRRGWPAPRETTFSLGEAKTAKLIKAGGAWETWPKRMVLARVVSFALHDYFADVLLGCAIAGDRMDHAVTVEAPARQERPAAPPAGPDPLLAGLASPKRCDGNHAAPRCADPGCWWDDEPVPPCDPGPPFPDHAAADRALADEDGQGRLLEPAPRRHRG